MKGEKMSAITVIYHFNQEPLAIEHCNGMMKSLKQYPADDIGTWRRRRGNIFLGYHIHWITPEKIG